MLTGGLDREFGKIVLPRRRAVVRTEAMNISIGRTVHYVLNKEDAEQINRRRTTGASIAERIAGWPIGAQAHIGNTVAEGMEFPAMCVRDWSQPGETNDPDRGDIPVVINLQVFLDGNDVYWATIRHEDQNTDKKQPPTPGTWHWPARE